MQEQIWPIKYLFSSETLWQITNMLGDNLVLWKAWKYGRVKAWDLYGDGQRLLQYWKLSKGWEILFESIKLKVNGKGLWKFNHCLLTSKKKIQAHILHQEMPLNKWKKRLCSFLEVRSRQLNKQNGKIIRR